MPHKSERANEREREIYIYIYMHIHIYTYRHNTTWLLFLEIRTPCLGCSYNMSPATGGFVLGHLVFGNSHMTRGQELQRAEPQKFGHLVLKRQRPPREPNRACLRNIQHTLDHVPDLCIISGIFLHSGISGLSGWTYAGSPTSQAPSQAIASCKRDPRRSLSNRR